MPRSPIELTDREIENLMKSFIRGKTQIDEDDAVTLVNWARESRARVFMLDLMIAGDVQPVVQDGQVAVQLPQTPLCGVWEVS